jgi:hypothetical protein
MKSAINNFHDPETHSVRLRPCRRGRGRKHANDPSQRDEKGRYLPKDKQYNHWPAARNSRATVRNNRLLRTP